MSQASYPVASLFPMDLLQIEMGAATDSLETNPGAVHFDDLNGGGPPTGSWCPVSELSDDFDDGVRGRPWQRGWESAECTRTEEQGQLVLRVDGSGTTDCGYGSSTSYDLTGRAVWVEAVQISADAGVYVLLRLERDPQLGIEMAYGNGQLACGTRTAGVSQLFASMPYQPAVHRWWRLSEQGGTISCETSADGSSWEFRGQTANPFDVRATDVLLIGGKDGAGSPIVTARFDNLNLGP